MAKLRVKEVAEARGFNQSSLSRASNVSFNTVKRIFKNPSHNVTMEILEKLATALGVKVQDLYEDESESR